MNKVSYYINGLGIVSPQKTYDNTDFLPQIVAYNNNVLSCIVPEFKEYINPIQLRRLSRMLRIGLTAAIICTRDSGNTKPDGIITATGYGFLNDTAKFVSEMLDQGEKHLTPTFFMQGTYNALSGLVALTLKCNGYNNTYVNRGFSFETSLRDAMMYLDEGKMQSFLVGAYDEADEVQYKVNSRVGHYKTKHTNSLQLFNQNSTGSLQGEGAAFFSIESWPGGNCWCILKGIKMIFKPGSVQFLEAELKNFLANNNLSVAEIHIVISGLSGDVETDKVLSALTTQTFRQVPELRFKHLCGEYCTASSFGFWIGASLLRKQQIPWGLQFNNASASFPVKNVLLVNQYMGRNYSFILLQACE
ncbi:MAG TPA: beta-ketoacyl synthase chain length factor [Flavitalea sp.]|nr:beta-ketoacyl synthase chain length factor [Flavitalea sp.]